MTRMLSRMYLLSLLVVAGCASLNVNVPDIPEIPAQRRERVDASNVPDVRTLDQAKIELNRAYAEIRYQQSKVQNREQEIEKLKREREKQKDEIKRLEKRLERYEKD